MKNELKMMLRCPRLNRVRYVSYLGFSYLVLFLISFLISTLWTLTYTLISNNPPKIGIIAAVSTAIPAIIFSVFSIRWAVGRLHDLNLSGKWLYLLLVIPIPLVFIPLGMETTCITLFVIFIILAFLAGIALIFIPGTANTNRFGEPSPKNTVFNYLFCIAYIAFSIITVTASVVEKMNSQTNPIAQEVKQSTDTDSEN